MMAGIILKYIMEIKPWVKASLLGYRLNMMTQHRRDAPFIPFIGPMSSGIFFSTYMSDVKPWKLAHSRETHKVLAKRLREIGG